MAPSGVDIGVLLTGVGKRYDIVSAFAQHATVIAADPNPLAPAQYAAHHRVAVPRIADPEYVPALQALCEEHNVGAVVPLTDLDIEVLAHARAAGQLPAFVPDPEIARATFDKYEAHLLLGRHGLPSPPTVLPGEPVPSFPVMVKPRQGSGARSIHRADDARAAEFFVDYVKEPTMVQRLMDGPEFSIDCLSDLEGRCLNAIPRTMIESRGGESIKGTVIADAELIDLGRRVVESLGVRGPCTVQVVPRPGDRARHHRRQHAVRRGVSRTDVRRAAGAHLSGADRADGAWRTDRAARRRFPGRGDVHPLLLAARTRRAASGRPPGTSSSRPVLPRPDRQVLEGLERYAAADVTERRDFVAGFAFCRESHDNARPWKQARCLGQHRQGFPRCSCRRICCVWRRMPGLSHLSVNAIRPPLRPFTTVTIGRFCRSVATCSAIPRKPRTPSSRRSSPPTAT